jgi:hypothetical protein
MLNLLDWDAKLRAFELDWFDHWWDLTSTRPSDERQYALASLNTRATVRNRMRTSNQIDQFCR